MKLYLPENHLFLFQEKAITLNMGRLERLKGLVRPWRYAAHSREIENSGIDLGRFSESNLSLLCSKVSDFYKSRDVKSKIDLVFQDDFYDSFQIDGAHSEIIKVIQKGINLEMFKRFYDLLKKEDLSLNEGFISGRWISGEEGDFPGYRLFGKSFN